MDNRREKGGSEVRARQLEEKPCAVCYHMFWPSELSDNTCALCRQDEQITKLRADVERLRTALEPFAAVVEVINKNAMCDGGPIPDESFLLAHWEWNTSSDITIGDCRNAARALGETK